LDISLRLSLSAYADVPVEMEAVQLSYGKSHALTRWPAQKNDSLSINQDRPNGAI
jgi:hypothetical protein